MKLISPQELAASVAATTAHLKKSGMGPGDRLAILAPNSLEQIILLVSLWRLKIITCPLNHYQPPSVIKKQLAHLQDPMLLNDNEVKWLVKIVKGTAPSPLRGISLAQPCTILFTSGSSAEPKAVLHTFGNYYHNALASNRRLKLKRGDRWLLSLPLYHVGGLSIVFRCLLAGATIAIPESREEAMQSLSRDKITHVSLVPTQLYRLLQRPKIYPSMKCMLIGGGPIPQNLLEAALNRRWPVHVTYGMTETTSQVATSERLTKNREPGAPVLSCIKVKISHKSEILVKGSTLFKGYVHKNAAHLPLTPDGWFNTHDLGEMKGGRLLVRGRRDNQFISGGENIQPEEIERHLLEFKGVAQACVVPRKDKEFGERPVAFLKFDRLRLSRKKIDTYLRTKIAAFKVPDAYYVWPASGADSSLKLSRKVLQQHLKSGLKLSKII